MLLTAGLELDEGLTCAVGASDKVKKIIVASRKVRKGLMV